MTFVSFSAVSNFEVDWKILIIIYRVNIGKFENDREIPEFNLIMIFRSFVLKWLRFKNEKFPKFTLDMKIVWC